MVTLGADPELFMVNRGTDELIPSCGLLGGRKGAPVPIPGLDEPGFGMQEDNVMLEFNIPPATSWVTATDNVSKAMQYIEANVMAPLGAKMSDKCWAELTQEQTYMPQARVVGCSVDNDAHNEGRYMPRMTARRMGDMRYAGGHVHLGYESAVPKHVAALMMDLFVGLWSIGRDDQGPRRSLYGNAGRYRETEYGIEYRPLSNFWITKEARDCGYTSHVFAKAEECGHLLESDPRKVRDVFLGTNWGMVAQVMRTQDVSRAATMRSMVRNDWQIGV